jgi:hypothetical protein
MKEIKLSQGKVALVDDEDYEYLNQWKWCVQKSHNTYYAIRTKTSPIRKTIRLHSLIMNTPHGKEVDHKDRNGLNNQKSNLRICTHAENQMNKIASGISKYLGVTRCIVRNKWRIASQININGKNKFIGYYKDEEEAAFAYDKKAKEVHGIYANLNFK